MTGIPFPEANHELGRPGSMTDEECYALPVAFSVYEERHPCVVSCWELSDAERQAIAEGANVYLHVIGRGMPPVLLSTQIQASPVELRR